MTSLTLKKLLISLLALTPIASVGSGSGSTPAEVVNAGWAKFIGRDGSVSELDALRLTAEGAQRAKGSDNHTYSVAMNNMAVFHKCAADPAVRDYEFGRKLGIKQIEGNAYSGDNFVWSIFLREENPPGLDSAKFYSAVREVLKDHPVARYSGLLQHKLPKSRDHAIRFLMDEALKGDPHAAQWVGFHFECSRNPINIPEAIKWFEISYNLMAARPEYRYEKPRVFDRLQRMRYLLHR